MLCSKIKAATRKVPRSLTATIRQNPLGTVWGSSQLGRDGMDDSYSGPTITQAAPYLRTRSRSLSSSRCQEPSFRSAFCGTMLE